MAKLEEENARLRARLDSMSKQTLAAHTAGPFVALARQFLGNSQKVDGIKKSIKALTEPAELLAIQEACANQCKLLIQKQSRGEVSLNNDMESIRRARWSKRHDILVTTGPTRSIAMNKIPCYHLGMNADEMLVMLGEDPNRTFVYGMNDNGSTNQHVVFAVGEQSGTHLVLEDADDCAGEDSYLPKDILAPLVDIEVIRASAPLSGCANGCTTCVGAQENHRTSRFYCMHLSCECFTDYCMQCGAAARESSDYE